jgi:hypothetical protein
VETPLLLSVLFLKTVTILKTISMWGLTQRDNSAGLAEGPGHKFDTRRNSTRIVNGKKRSLRIAIKN